jgi:hypothetical protein
MIVMPVLVAGACVFKALQVQRRGGRDKASHDDMNGSQV